jgi:hypothetical protein
MSNGEIIHERRAESDYFAGKKRLDKIVAPVSAAQVILSPHADAMTSALPEGSPPAAPPLSKRRFTPQAEKSVPPLIGACAAWITRESLERLSLGNRATGSRARTGAPAAARLRSIRRGHSPAARRGRRSTMRRFRNTYPAPAETARCSSALRTAAGTAWVSCPRSTFGGSGCGLRSAGARGSGIPHLSPDAASDLIAATKSSKAARS